MRPNRDEEVYLDSRLHGAVLARPIFRSLLLVLLGIAALVVPLTPMAALGAVLIAAGVNGTIKAAMPSATSSADRKIGRASTAPCNRASR